MMSGVTVHSSNPSIYKSSGAQQFAHAENVINNWTPKLEVYPLTKSHFVNSGLASLSAFYINRFYRHAVNLHRSAYAISAISVVVLPAALGALLFQELVKKQLILSKFSCLICAEIRGGFIQMVSGAFYPMLLSPLLSFQFSERYLTYAMPSFREPKALLYEYVRLSKPLFRRLPILIGMQFAVGMGLTHLQIMSLQRISTKLLQKEEELRRLKDEYTG